MCARQTGWGLALLWLAGCTAPGPTRQEQVQVQAQEQRQEQAQEQEEAEAEAAEQVPVQVEELREQDQTLTATRMLDGLEQVASLNPKTAKQMLQHLRTSSAELTAGDRFVLALLLSQKNTDEKSLKRALLLLNKLEADTKEPGVREVLRLQRHSLNLEQRYRMEREKTVELQIKIEHLKGLERELDESNKRMEEPLTPNPERVP